MEQLKTLITMSCMLSITVGICNILKPSALFERQIRFLISMLFVIGLAAPLVNIEWKLTPITSRENTVNAQTASLTQQAQDLILSQTAAHTETALEELFNLNGIKCSELQVTAHIDEGQCIYISEVSTVCSDSQRACEILRTNLGEEVILRVTEMVQTDSEKG